MRHVDIDELLEALETEQGPKSNGQGPTFTFRGEVFHVRAQLPSLLKLDYLWEKLNEGLPGSLTAMFRAVLRDETEVERLVALEPQVPETNVILTQLGNLYAPGGLGESGASDGSSGTGPGSRRRKPTSRKRTASTSGRASSGGGGSHRDA